MNLNLDNYDLDRVDKTRIEKDRTSIAMILKCILCELQGNKTIKTEEPEQVVEETEESVIEEVEVEPIPKQEINLNLPYKDLLSTAKDISLALDIKLPQARSVEALKAFIKDNT